MAAYARRHDDVFAPVDVLLDLQSEIGKQIQPPGSHFHNAVMASEGANLRLVGDGVPHDFGIEVSQPGIEVAPIEGVEWLVDSVRRSPATSPAQYPAGSGVGVSVLLRQPQGFEGLLATIVGRHLHGPSMPEPVGVALLKLRAQPPLPPSHTEVDGHGGAVLPLDDPFHVKLEPLPGFADRIPEAPYAVVPA